MFKEKRQRILDAATTAFSLYGYKGTTMDKVATLANIGKGTIYTTFENKEDLFNAILQHIIEEMEYIFHQFIDPNKELTENVNHAMFELLAYRRKHQVLQKLNNEAKWFGEEHSKHALKKVEEAIISCLKNTLIQANVQNKIYLSKPDLTAYLLYKQYMTLVVEFEEDRYELSKAELIDIFTNHVLYALKYNPDI